MEDKQFEELLSQIEDFLENSPLNVISTLPDNIYSAFTALHPSEQADIITELKGKERDIFINLTLPEIDPDILLHFDKAILNDFAEHIGNEKFGKMLSAMAVNQTVSVLSDFSKDKKRRILEFVQFRKRFHVKKLLSYPEESAGRHMNTDFASISENATIKEMLEYMKKYIKNTKTTANNFEVFALAKGHTIAGSLSLLEAFKLKPGDKIKSHIKKITHAASTFDDISEVIDEFIEYKLQVIPVVNGNQELVGILEINNIAELIKEEAEKNLLAPVGVFETTKEGIFGLARARFAWLFINLITASAASSLISIFEPLVASFATLAVLTPIVASIGGNTGNQSSAVIIRSLAINEFEPRLVIKELMVSSINSVCLCCISFIMSYLIYRNFPLSLSFSLAILINLIMGGVMGTSIPILLTKLKLDPALCSSIFLTMFTDMTGFFSFLGIAYFLV